MLKDTGIMFLNLGDSWAGSNCGSNDYRGRKQDEKFQGQKVGTQDNIPSKCKLLIPHRVAIALIDDGWILRSDIVWHSPNKMPESVKDRPTKSYEFIFMFVKSQKYYFDMDAVLEPYTKPMDRWGGEKLIAKGSSTWDKGTGQSSYRNRNMRPNEKGKNIRDVWIIPTEPSRDGVHYAKWPQKLVERMILCSTKPGDTVLDAFCGSGTTLRVADRLNRVAYGIDLGYEDIQKNKLSLIQKDLLEIEAG